MVKGAPSDRSLSDKDTIKAVLVSEFSDIFNPLSLPPMHSKQMKIYLKADANNAPRTIPHAYREQIKTQIEELVQKGIIEAVTEPSELCHPMVIIPKKGSSEKRLAVDLMKWNKQVKRPVHPARTIRNTQSDIDTAQYFTTLDARHGYWQAPLAEE